MLRRVPWVPIQHQIRRRNRPKHAGRFRRISRIASRFIFQQQYHAFFARRFRRLPQSFIHRRPIRRRILDPPKIKKTHPVRLKRLRQLHAPLQHLLLLLIRKVCIKLSLLRTEFRLRRPRPIHLEQRARNIRHSQFVLFQYPPRLCDFLRVQIQQVLVPHPAQLDPFHSKFPRRHLARPPKILADLVVDHRPPERRFHTFTPSFSSKYFLLIAPHSFGVRALSGTASNSTIAQPRNFTLCSASNTPGKSTFPRPNSTNRYARFGSFSSGSASTSLICKNSSRSPYFSIAFAGSPPP